MTGLFLIFHNHDAGPSRQHLESPGVIQETSE
jgi:hypothetical protein